jgi:hypothetical protein
MSTYPVNIRRCYHIKVNGIQCGSPAIRNEKYCFFHEECRVLCRQLNMRYKEYGIIKLPTLEDANSIQLGLGEVMRLLITQQIDHKVASLLLRALRTAATNVKFTSLEPKPTHVVIDRKCVENRPLGATAWSNTEGRDYDLIGNEDGNEEGKENGIQSGTANHATHHPAGVTENKPDVETVKTVPHNEVSDHPKTNDAVEQLELNAQPPKDALDVQTESRNWS